jgi:beta-1,4-N-acetylglucosaminyltransferase
MTNSKKRCFATVGSTSFDDLIQTLLSNEVLQSLREKGFTDLVMQYGSGQIDELENKETSNFIKDGINVSPFGYYYPTLEDQINDS